MSLGLALGVTSALMQAYSMYAQGQQEQYNYQYNASLKAAESQIAQASFQFEAARIREKGAETIGAQQAKFANSMVRFVGSPVDATIKSAKQVELDVFAANFNAQASLISANSKIGIDLIMGNAAYQSGIVGAGASLAQSAYSIYSDS